MKKKVEGKVIGLTPRQFTDWVKRKRKKRPQDATWDQSMYPHSRTTFNDQIADFILGNNMGFEEFVFYLSENVKPIIDEALKKQAEEKAQKAKEAKTKAIEESKPISKLIHLVGTRFSEPYNKQMRALPLKDLLELQRQISRKKPFIQFGYWSDLEWSEAKEYLSVLITQKTSQNTTPPKSALTKLVQAFRGH